MIRVKTGNSKLVRSARCRIDLKLTLADGRLFARTTYKIGQIAHHLASKRWQTAFLRVRYGRGLKNSATATTLADAIYFLNAFTEAELIGYLTSKESSSVGVGENGKQLNRGIPTT